MQHDRAAGERGVAAPQAAEARAARQRGVGLQGRPDDLPAEVHDRVERRHERAAGPAGEAARRRHPAQPGGVERGRRERVAAWRSRARRAWPEKKLETARVGAFAEVAAEHRVPGEGHHLELGVRDLGRHLAGVGGRRAQVLRARRGSAWARSGAGLRSGAGARRRATRRTLPAGSRRRRWRRRRGRSRCSAGPRGRRGLRPAGWLRRRAARPRERGLLAGRGGEQRFVDVVGCFDLAVRGAASGSDPRRGRAGAAAGQGRRAGPSARRPAAAPAARGSRPRPRSSAAARPRPASPRGGGRWPSYTEPPSAWRRRRAFSAARSATGSPVMPAQARLAAQFAQHARDRLEAGDRERFGPVDRDDRVEHAALRRAGGSAGRTRARPWCRRRCRTGRAFRSRPRPSAPRCRVTLSAVVKLPRAGPICERALFEQVRYRARR